MMPFDRPLYSITTPCFTNGIGPFYSITTPCITDGIGMFVSRHTLNKPCALYLTLSVKDYVITPAAVVQDLGVLLDTEQFVTLIILLVPI